MEDVEKQRKNKGYANLIPYKKGQSGNPKGRPKGQTIKEKVRAWLDENPNDMESFVKHFAKKNKELAWQMLEGRPAQATDVTTGGDKLTFNVISFDDYDTTQPEAE